MNQLYLPPKPHPLVGLGATAQTLETKTHQPWKETPVRLFSNIKMNESSCVSFASASYLYYCNGHLRNFLPPQNFSAPLSRASTHRFRQSRLRFRHFLRTSQKPQPERRRLRGHDPNAGASGVTRAPLKGPIARKQIEPFGTAKKSPMTGTMLLTPIETLCLSMFSLLRLTNKICNVFSLKT